MGRNSKSFEHVIETKRVSSLAVFIINPENLNFQYEAPKKKTRKEQKKPLYDKNEKNK